MCEGIEPALDRGVPYFMVRVKAQQREVVQGNWGARDEVQDKVYVKHEANGSTLELEGDT